MGVLEIVRDGDNHVENNSFFKKIYKTKYT